MRTVRTSTWRPRFARTTGWSAATEACRGPRQLRIRTRDGEPRDGSGVSAFSMVVRRHESAPSLQLCELPPSGVASAAKLGRSRPHVGGRVGAYPVSASMTSDPWALGNDGGASSRENPTPLRRPPAVDAQKNCPCASRVRPSLAVVDASRG